MTDRLPTLFIPHGGGPCFFMDWGPSFPRDMWDSMADFLKSLAANLAMKPKAILVVSAHWETPTARIIARERNTLLYDYQGFPPHTYELKYDAPGAPELADRVISLLGDAGIPAERDTMRGLDHGVFIPLLLVYPEADIPVTQLSLPQGASEGDLLTLGRAISPLRDEGVLIVATGMTYHNIGGILGRVPNQANVSAEFDHWLWAALNGPDRETALAGWPQAPHASQCHPSPEHLLPLLVTAGAGHDEPVERIYNAPTLGNLQSAYRFGARAA